MGVTQLSEDDLREQCSMTHWWPRLESTVVPTPETIRVPTEGVEVDDGAPATDGTMTVQLAEKDAVADAVEALDGPPAFIRSDQMSDKHRMEEASKLSSADPDEFGSNIWNLHENHMMAWGVPDAKCYYVREWLDLLHYYTAFSGTPIAAEIRYFIHEGEVHDGGFYWPEEAIRRPDADDWEEKHQGLVHTAFQAKDRIRPHLETVCEEFDSGYWSVDFALTEEREWYCIDMARGELSWHPEGCEKPEEVVA